MSSQVRAIALCRVSSIEQLENNSLNRQGNVVRQAAEQLGAIIPDEYWLSGSVSSKRGTNLSRKDLQTAQELCKKDKQIKYIIVDEPDRFMRSIDEAAYFEVIFRQMGVSVWYASDPELNKGDLASRLLKFTKFMSAEGSNEERQRKSISGQSAALKEGRYPFAPKPGYKRGYEKAVQEVDPVRGPALKLILEKISNKLITPSQGLVELNKSDFVKGYSSYKMDKFRKILCDPFYAGIVEIDRQVKVRNENGLHEPLITKSEHCELIKIMSDKKKNQSGPRKNGNPDFPLSNLVSCKNCVDDSIGRFVGFKHSNGKNKANIYERYRCRGCGKYLKKEELHADVQRQFNGRPISKEGIDDLLSALKSVWKAEENQSVQECRRIKHRISCINQSIENSIEAVTDPSNVTIKEEILSSINGKKEQVKELEEQLDALSNQSRADEEQFLRFAFDFIDNMGNKYLDTTVVSPENRKRCKQVLFPGGFYVDENKKVYTPEVSELYRLATKKKDTEVSENSLMVQQVRKSLHLIRDEIALWRKILDVPYREHLLKY